MRKTIMQAMQLFSKEFKGFEANDTVKLEMWCELLSDIPKTIIERASWALICDGLDYPPNGGKLRKKALLLLNDGLLNVNSSEAWGSILKKMRDPSFKLTDLEQRALDNTGDIFSLKRKNDLGFDRSFFVRNFDILLQREIQKVSVPEKMRMVENVEVKKITGKVEKEPEPKKDTDTEPMTDAEKSDAVKNIVKNLKEGLGNGTRIKNTIEIL